ncbi:MAG: ATP-dependent DNA ligase [Deltaproteobacteria bacterium]|nr:ATP-dependent DNA ligase [Deltaproteobacteria bacterium]
MLAKLTPAMPEAGGYLFEPKWDGFRALIFRDGDEVHIQSREKKPLERYFPELIPPLLAQLPRQAVLDGEIVLPRGGALDFEALQLRLHPAASRVKKLSVETPVSFVAFDLLAEGEEDLRERPMHERRARLERLFADSTAPLFITPATTDVTVARDWFRRFEGAGLDGVIAKPLDVTYQPNKRAMLKIKHRHTVDCVAAGFRWHKDGVGERVGSILLGLYDAQVNLQHVGITSSFTAARRAELVEELAPLREGALDAHPWAAWAGAEEQQTRKPGYASRWSAGKDLSWEPLRIERVVEVSYDHLEGRRFRHAATFHRFRFDREPASCTYAQLEAAPPEELSRFFGGGALLVGE